MDNIAIEGSASELLVEIVDTTQGNVSVKVNLTDPVTGEEIPISAVNVTLPDGTTKEFPIEDGNIILPLDVGNNKITISYPGDDTYNATNVTFNIPVEHREAAVEVDVTNATAGNTTVKVKVTDPVTGNPVTNGEVSITVNGEEVGRLPVGSDGTVTIPTTIANTGSTSIVATYEGNENYTSKSVTAENVNILPKESKIAAELSDSTQGDTTLKVELFDPVTGKGLDGKVTVTLPGSSPVEANAVGGIVEIPVDLPVGNSTLKVTYLGNQTYGSVQYEVPVTVNKRPTKVESKVINNVAGDVTVGVKVVDQLTNKALNTGRVLVMDGNKVVGTATLDKNGEATVKTNITKSDEYDLTIVYEGDINHSDNTTESDNVKVAPRESKVTTNVTNTNVGQTEVNITITDPSTNMPIDGEVIVTLPNGTKVKAVAESGNVVVPVDLPVGDSTITVTYPGNETYDEVVVKVPVKVNKRATKSEITQVSSDAGNVTYRVKVTDETSDEPVNTGKVTISVDGKVVGTAKVVDGVAIVNTNIKQAGNYKLDINYTGTQEYEPTHDTLRDTVTPRELNVEVKVLNNTVADTKMQIMVTDAKTGKAVPNETVTVTLGNGTKIKVTTDKKGQATVDTELSSGNNTVTVSVSKNSVYNSSTTTVKTTVKKAAVRVVVDSVTGIVGEKIKLTAHITDEYGNLVTGGNLVFKLNGRSLRTDGRFDTNKASPMKISVKNGLVTFTMTADLYLRAGKNITASYSGSYKYESAKANTAEANIKKRSASITVKTSKKLVKQGQNIVFTATVKDVTVGSSKSLINNNSYVIFKINGKTLKDSKGKVIKVKLVNGVAKYTYRVPLGTSGMVDGHMRDYMVTAVYANDIYYPDVRDTVAYNVERSPTKINITSATVKNDKLSIKANILDQYGNNVIGKNQISIKINGKTFKVDGKSLTYTVKDGKINIKGIKLNGNKVKSLTIITGERQSYYDSQVTTKKVKTN
ncbi:MAG: hypothetical protein BZ138_06815 [Methanosphaera sp. rholeuAM270]|nr:MAG: hypothetical protein BZ138_06815 [Methanosphaera sp. rholeuAM270]